MRNHGLGASVGVGTDIRSFVLLAPAKKAAADISSAEKTAVFSKESLKTRA